VPSFIYFKGPLVKNHIINISVAALLIVTSYGCAVYDPVAAYTKQRYTNAVSYFNTYYNAQRLFSDAEDEVLKARRDFYERNASGKLPGIPSSARQKFQTSIEKNSKVLTFYPDSKWVDDALLMIGKAYYYMDDDVRAERKFQELSVQFPASDLVLESQLWLGKSLMRQKKFDQGLKQLTDVFTNGTETDEETAGLAAFETAQYYFDQGQYPQAERQYTLAVDLVGDSELQTRIYFQLGKCFTEMEQFEKAQQAYTNAMDNSPLYSLKFQAELQIHKIHSLQRQYQEAVNGLTEMLTDTKNSDFFGTIHFELAGVLMQKGEINEAIEKYRYIDTAFARTDEAARSYFILAEYYQMKEFRYDSATVLYGKARNEYAASEITKIAAERSEIFTKYDQLRKDLSRYDSLLTSTITVKLRNDSLAAMPQSDSLKMKDTIAVKEEVKIKKMTKAGKSVKDTVTAVTVDSTKIKDRMSKEESHLKMVDSLQRSIVRTKFELGGLFFLEIQQPDSAQRWFNEVVQSAPKSEFAPRALYTIAEIYRGMNKQPSELEPYYRRIIEDYPASPYANEARKNLALPVISAVKDTAIAAFERAEALNDASQFEAAVSAFKKDPGSVSRFTACTESTVHSRLDL
jgi:tetratricopeptide (TPR) repeat protein